MPFGELQPCPDLMSPNFLYIAPFFLDPELLIFLPPLPLTKQGTDRAPEVRNKGIEKWHHTGWDTRMVTETHCDDFLRTYEHIPTTPRSSPVFLQELAIPTRAKGLKVAASQPTCDIILNSTVSLPLQILSTHLILSFFICEMEDILRSWQWWLN